MQDLLLFFNEFFKF